VIDDRPLVPHVRRYRPERRYMRGSGSRRTRSADLREGWPVHAKDSLSTCRRNARTILLDYAASKPPVEAKASYICLEDPQVQAGDRSPCRKLTGSITKQPLTYSLTTSLRANVKIVYQTSPDGIEIAIAADNPWSKTISMTIRRRRRPHAAARAVRRGRSPRGSGLTA
jgi:hypothetical protein